MIIELLPPNTSQAFDAMRERSQVLVSLLLDQARSDGPGAGTAKAELATHLDPVRATLFAEWEVLDAVTFVHRAVLPRLELDPAARVESIAVHPTWSTEHLGIHDDLIAVAGAAAREVQVPPSWGCCGFAGDRGMLHPELTAGATEAEAGEIAELEAERGTFSAYASCNRTCEMGMSRATGRDYEHVLEVLARVTR